MKAAFSRRELIGMTDKMDRISAFLEAQACRKSIPESPPKSLGSWPKNEGEPALRRAVMLRRVSQGARTELSSRASAVLANLIDIDCKHGVLPWPDLAETLGLRRQGLPTPASPQTASLESDSAPWRPTGDSGVLADPASAANVRDATSGLWLG
ncbi:hypothetical protein G3480_08800 [Thiorhodococcus mannitoliphagus]|uniref:Uncharacterized protein n=1 Tax=Thiorhodococcus mannitoliphagus TaxID=329406 RepID=A0A6P1DXQ0_9GAMM|nr:hypothetical protein [Thiorhodococcus mannitoliphagus]NEX20405.1 hypothetical protein [Thiorhodococcus mannitoliphagus]